LQLPLAPDTVVVAMPRHEQPGIGMRTGPDGPPADGDDGRCTIQHDRFLLRAAEPRLAGRQDPPVRLEYAGLTEVRVRIEQPPAHLLGSRQAGHVRDVGARVLDHEVDHLATLVAYGLEEEARVIAEIEGGRDRMPVTAPHTDRGPLRERRQRTEVAAFGSGETARAVGTGEPAECKNADDAIGPAQRMRGHAGG
jgi:hypothetical protein